MRVIVQPSTHIKNGRVVQVNLTKEDIVLLVRNMSKLDKNAPIYCFSETAQNGDVCSVSVVD